MRSQGPGIVSTMSVVASLSSFTALPLFMTLLSSRHCISSCHYLVLRLAFLHVFDFLNITPYPGISHCSDHFIACDALVPYTPNRHACSIGTLLNDLAYIEAKFEAGLGSGLLDELALAISLIDVREMRSFVG